MKKIIEDLTSERKQLQERIETIDNAINAFRKVCLHKNANGVSTFVEDGHDSHHNYYRCSICGEIDKD